MESLKRRRFGIIRTHSRWRASVTQVRTRANASGAAPARLKRSTADDARTTETPAFGTSRTSATGQSAQNAARRRRMPAAKAVGKVATNGDETSLARGVVPTQTDRESQSLCPLRSRRHRRMCLPSVRDTQIIELECRKFYSDIPRIEITIEDL